MLRENVSLHDWLYIGLLILPLVYLVWCGLRGWHLHLPTTVSDDDAAVPDAATATNFQLTSVYPNATFGAISFLIIPLFNALALLAGNAITLKRFRRTLEAIEKYKTPHQYIAQIHRIPGMQRLTASISVFVFVAVAAFEMVFLAKIGTELIGAGPRSYYAFMVCIIVLNTLAVVLGGQYANIISDRWLLPVAYVGTHLGIAVVLLNSKPKALDIVSVLVLLLLGVMLFIRLRAARSVTLPHSARHWVIILSTAALLCSIIYGFWIEQLTLSSDTLSLLGKSFSPKASGLDYRVYVIAFLAALCPAVFYNFVDFSFWQKYSIDLERFETIDDCLAKARRSFWLYYIESPLTLLLPVLLGFYAVGSLPDADLSAAPLSSTIQFISRQHFSGGVISGLLFLSLTAIACSTSSSYLAALGDLWAKDIAPRRDPPALGWTYSVLVAAILLVVLVPIDYFAKTTDQLILLLLTTLAPLCAMTPHVVWPLVFRRDLRLTSAGKFGVALALGAGGLAGLIFGVGATLSEVSPQTLIFWVPMPLAFFISWILYLISCFLCSVPGEKGDAILP